MKFRPLIIGVMILTGAGCFTTQEGTFPQEDKIEAVHLIFGWMTGQAKIPGVPEDYPILISLEKDAPPVYFICDFVPADTQLIDNSCFRRITEAEADKRFSEQKLADVYKGGSYIWIKVKEENRRLLTLTVDHCVGLNFGQKHSVVFRKEMKGLVAEAKVELSY
jgi:hypothetical protein